MNKPKLGSEVDFCVIFFFQNVVGENESFARIKGEISANDWKHVAQEIQTLWNPCLERKTV